MAAPKQTFAKRKPRWQVTFRDEQLFSWDDIVNVSRYTEEIRKMSVPPDAPQSVSGISADALPAHVKKCQKDVDEWDDPRAGILVGMSKLANDLRSFCSDSMAALEQLQDTSKRIDKEFDELSDADKDNLSGEMNEIFSQLLQTTEISQTRSGGMATRLGSFRKVLSYDASAAESLRENYQDYIQDREQAIRDWERGQGLKPSDDLIKDLNDKIDETNERIRQKEAEYIAASAGAGAAGAASLNPLFWIVSIPGVIVGSVFAGIRGDELKDLKTEIQGYLDKLGESRRLNTLKIWFDSEKQTFDALIENLEACRQSVARVQGQWQTFANDLGQLIGESGKLARLKKDGWQRTLSDFMVKMPYKVYAQAEKDLMVFEKNIFVTENNVEVLHPKAA